MKGLKRRLDKLAQQEDCYSVTHIVLLHLVVPQGQFDDRDSSLQHQVITTMAHDWRKNDYLKDVLTLPKYFMKHGYRSIGGGKIFHELEHCRGHNDLSSWDDFFPGGQKQMPKACHPEEKPNVAWFILIGVQLAKKLQR